MQRDLDLGVQMQNTQQEKTRKYEDFARSFKRPMPLGGMQKDIASNSSKNGSG